MESLYFLAMLLAAVLHGVQSKLIGPEWSIEGSISGRRSAKSASAKNAVFTSRLSNLNASSPSGQLAELMGGNAMNTMATITVITYFKSSS